jgi:hypothetical protein
MATIEEFKQDISAGYGFQNKSILLGAGMLDGKAVPGTAVRIPLSTVNRHGLIAGATGTGKTKTIQQFAESLSENGVNVLLMDIKGDLSGIAKPGMSNPKIEERHQLIGQTWQPFGAPVELFSISDEKGVRLRATVSEFGPVLFSKILELNETQQGAVTIVFSYCDKERLPLLDIKDFREALRFLTEEGKDRVKEYGQISTTSAGVIFRKLLEIEQQGADLFFGERSFEVEDFMAAEGALGRINVLRLCDIQEKPKLFSTFMLCLLAEIYQKFPELGDKAAPKLAIFIDEAHLIFRDATKNLLDQLETVVKLIRSKGVGLYFCTQVPSDIPDIILSQLGAKFQHALRAFTAKDRKDIKLVAQNYPETNYYRTEELLTGLGIGEALVTVLNEKGIPTPLVHTLLCAPRSRMDVLTPAEQEEIVRRSPLADRYNETVDRESAYEILKGKLNRSPEAESSSPEAPERERPTEKERAGGGILDSLVSATKNPLVKTVARELTRGLLGAFLGKPTRRR